MQPERRPLPVFLILAGTVCLFVCLLLLMHQPVQAQDTNDYAGTGDCNDCHRRVGRQFEASAHALSLFAPDDYPDAIIADFSTGADIRLFRFPGEAEMRPFTLNDVAYVIGSGRRAQRYATQAGTVLPAEWNVELGGWQTFALPNGDNWQTSCASCHTTGYNTLNDTWSEPGVSCEACHGPGLAHVELADAAGNNVSDEEEQAILAAITTHPEPELCGSCHTGWITEEPCTDPLHCGSSAYDAWRTSPHAEMVSAEDGHAGYALECSACHTVHSEASVNTALLSDTAEIMCLSCHESQADDLIEGHQIVESIAGKPSAHYDAGLTCESCHSPHAVQAIPTDPSITTACINCHTNLTDAGMREFATGAQDKFNRRVAQIEKRMNADTPEWVGRMLTVVKNDGSAGIHNIAYVSRLLDAAETELGILTRTTVANVPPVSPADPTDCAECHSDVHDVWRDSPHANASLGANFQRAYAENGQPSYCMSCHASGYDAATQTYVFEGVVCSTCHVAEAGEHPPGPMPIAESSEACGRCHSGEHSPEYNEWLVSDHSLFNIDCVDCHVAHDNSLRLGDVNTTCGDCHQDAMNDEVHMGEDMTCVDCHMTRSYNDGEVIHHTMFFDPKTCATCHGDIHNLQADLTRGLDDTGRSLLASMQQEVDTLRTKADTSLQSGIVGGAVGALVLVGFLFLALRIGRIK